MCVCVCVCERERERERVCEICLYFQNRGLSESKCVFNLVDIRVNFRLISDFITS